MKDLTPKERERLELICQGKMNKEIADIMGTTLGSVKVRNTELYDKLETEGKVDTIIKYYKGELIW